ncbi:MAG: DUF4105 domain-containing protein [Tannerella sp.]|jgi:hypothetical protein|nr:DUF4105 domain-containing protein [Tannerella sp.]
MKPLYFIIISICSFTVISTKYAPAAVSQAPPLSAQAQISLLTSSPADDDVYTLYGHTALRVYDPRADIDIIFNYGIFDFSRPNFIYRFAKGETDYMVAAQHFSHYLLEYINRGSEIYEQILNLLPEEKEALWQALVINERPENRVYRYNFFFDNCATRPAAMIENKIRGTIKYPLHTGQLASPDADAVATNPSSVLSVSRTGQATFRDAINFCTRLHPWVTFGCDLVMGAPTDRVMTFKETFFLPEYLKEAFGKAEIKRDSVVQPLVLKVNILSEKMQTAEESPPFMTSPLACFTLVCIIIIWLTRLEWRKKTYFGWLDTILFSFAGIAGCILFFLSFFSVHPCMFPNISLLWLHPFHLIGAAFFSVKKFNKPAFWYHFINFAAILGMLIVWIFITQHFNIAFIPLIASLWLRSGWTLIKKKVI